MKSGGAKAKGNLAENNMLRLFRTILPDSYKTLGSGNAKDDKGDIIFGPFCDECKHHKSFSKSEIDKYWVKIVEEAKSHKKEPLLVCKENNKEAVVYFYSHIDYFADTVRVSVPLGEFITLIRSVIQ